MNDMKHLLSTAVVHNVRVVTTHVICFVFAAGISTVYAGPLDGYADEAAWKAQLAEIDATDAAAVTSLGVTSAGRDISVITIAQGEPEKRPGILIVGNVVAPHLIGGELATRLARSLAAPDDAGKPPVAALLERFTVYVIPRPSPDATELCFAAPYLERVANTRPADDDRDGDAEEDGPEDLNGDGLITQLRIEDVEGDQIPHPNETRILIPADRSKQERGIYRVITEGVDNDHDEAFNEDPPGGVDFHRNFTFGYRFFQPGVGPNPISEPESRAVADFCFAHPNIALVFAFSPEDNLFRPWEANNDAAKARIKIGLLPVDAPYTKLLAERFQKLHGGADAPESSSYDGSFVRWAYFHYGRWSFASRAWWPPKIEPPKAVESADGEKKEPPKEDERAKEQVNAVRWLDQQGISGFVPWTPIDHPDFPGKKVEIGGFKPFVTLNPPAAELEALAKKHLDFVLSLPEALPRLAIKNASVESLGAGVYRISAMLVNEGQLPTLPEMGRIAEHPYPLQVTLAIPTDSKLIAGSIRQPLPPLAGSGGFQKLEWLLQATPSTDGVVRIHAASPAVGEASADVNLK